MFIENGANQLVTYCAQVARIMREETKRDTWTPVLEYINSELPRGSGFDAGSSLDVDQSTKGRLVFKTAFHHMNNCGMYDGWTDHSVIVTPAFNGFSIRVTGRNRNDIKEYIADRFHDILSQYVKTQYNAESREMSLRAAQYNYGFNGPIARKEF